MASGMQQRTAAKLEEIEDVCVQEAGPDGDPSAANYSHSVRLTGTFCLNIDSNCRICGAH